MNLRDQDHKEDKELLAHYYLDRNNEWLGILLQRYTMLLFGVCMKYLKNEEEAKDAVQQIYLKVIDELHKFRVDYFKSWLYIVAKNHCLMQLRSKGKFTHEIHENLVSINEDISGLREHIDKDKLLENMNVAMQQLNHEQQLCVNLFYLEMKSYQEVAEATGFNLLQVKSHIQNGKRNLKLIIERLQQNG